MVVSVVKIAIVLEYNSEEQNSILRILWAKGINLKDTYKEMFPIYCGKCLSRKGVHNWVKKFPRGRSKFANDARRGVEVIQTMVKRLLCCGV
jgi:hypothetical protein